MPNHVSSNLVITGPSDDVRRFVSHVDRSVTNAGNALDFNGVVPLPEELKETSSPAYIRTQTEIDNLWSEWNQKKDAGKLSEGELKYGKPFNLGITQEVNDTLIEKYGDNNWYEWAVTNWGTKWGAYDTGEWDVIVDENDNSSAKVSYNTAWGPATEFFMKASLLFPTLTFNTEYADEGGEFVGQTSYENGDVTNHIDYDWNSDKGIEVRERVGYDLIEFGDEDVLNEDVAIETIGFSSASQTE